jgi:ABC-type multidrug transport system fused ATPase/permease subunit
MELATHLGKLMLFLAACSASYEIISKEAKQNLNEWLSKNLNTQNFIYAFGVLFLSVATVHLFINFAGYITPVIAGFLFGVPYVFLIVLAFRVHFLLGIVLVVPIAFVTAGIAWFLSWITPHVLLEHAFLPYSAFSSLAAKADGAIIQWLVPPLIFDDFQTEFASVNAGLKSFIPDDVSWFVKVFSGRYWWNKIYHANTDFPLLISIICTQLAYFYSLLLVGKLMIFTSLFPLFQAADAVKKRTRIEKEHFPVMGIILGVFGATVEYVTFLISSQ